jgi:hypothetical protein
MCVRPNFYTLTTCKDCGHKRKICRGSDLIYYDQIPSICNKCGNHNTEWKNHEYLSVKIAIFFKNPAENINNKSKLTK